jgi:hypothetical protein
VALLLAAGCTAPADQSPSTTPTKTSASKTGTATGSSSATTSAGTTTSGTDEPTTTLSETGTASQTTTDQAPPTQPTFDCPDGQVVEEHATHGADEALPTLAWAALKTGQRFAVVWSSTAASTGTLRFSVQGAAYSTLTETVPTKAHVFVLQGLPQDGHICFEASEGTTKAPIHAARLSNAMFAYDAQAQSYTVNLMVLVNEAGDRAEVEEGADLMARMIWDATDGWVRVGNVLVVVNDLQHHNVGYIPCFALATTPRPPCAQYWDVIFTNDASPQGAASTYRKGVRDDYAAVWMNQYHQAMPGPLSLDETGAVLTHELGHYLFDMDDLYGDNTVVTSECFDSATGISIMAGSRDATEFDDPVALCKNQPAGYTTSWELLQGEFPNVADRPAGPVKGPSGDGGAYARFDYVAI